MASALTSQQTSNRYTVKEHLIVAETAKPLQFEAALVELNRIVSEMEEGKLSLETSLQQFEQGISLIRQCQTALKNAEQKVQLLMDQDGKAQAELTSYNDDTE